LAAIAAVAAFSAITLSSDQSSTTQAPAPATQGVTAQTSGARGGMTAFRDPDTGLLREPTADEAAALLASQTLQQTLGPSRLSVAASSEPVPIVSATGIEGLQLGEEQMTFTVATRSTDGTVAVQHAIGKKAAEQKVRDNAVPRGLVAGKEGLLER
jgi:hypothetical protein